MHPHGCIEPRVRIELTTPSLPWKCSATELSGRARCFPGNSTRIPEPEAALHAGQPPVCSRSHGSGSIAVVPPARSSKCVWAPYERPVLRSEEHTSELQSLMRISYAVFCLKKKKSNE